MGGKISRVEDAARISWRSFRARKQLTAADQTFHVWLPSLCRLRGETGALLGGFLLVLAQDFQKSGGGVREGHPAAMRRPERAVIIQPANGDGSECAALKLLAHAHARGEGQADL